MKRYAKIAGAVALVAGLSRSTVGQGSTYVWARGAAGTFAWNNNPTGTESSGSANWGGTAPGPFPSVAGDIAEIQTQSASNQTLDLDQNITVGELLPGRPDAGGASGFITIATGTAGNGANNTLTFNNGASNAILEQVDEQTTDSIVSINVPILIGGDGTLVVSNDTRATVPLTLSGNISSGLSSGVQSLVNGASSNGVIPSSVIISGSIGNGTTGGTMAVVVNTSTSNLTLTGTNSYSGGTTISAGTLQVNSASSGTGTGSINMTGGTLNGTGSVTSAITVANGATLQAGTGGGTATFHTGAVSDSGTTSFAINSSTLTNDELVVNGALTLAGTATLSVKDLGSATLANSQFVLISASGGISGTFAGLADNSQITVGSNTYTISYDQAGGDEVTLSTATPEPAMLGTFMLAGLPLLRRRRAKA